MENNQELTRKEILEKEFEKRRQRKKVILVLVISILTISLVFTIQNFNSRSDEKAESLANCLSGKGAIMYGTEWCSFCNQQKKLFGNSFSKINYVDCDKNRELCIEQGVQAYPTWEINGELELGLLSLDLLSELSGC
jgi:glutaredoxin